MEKRLAGACAFIVVLGGCGAVTPEHGEHRIGGSLRGLWDGAAGVVLQLEADGATAPLTVSTNGAFSFTKQLAGGTSYAVTIVTNPGNHTCVVEDGDQGTVADVDIMNVSVACSGPASIDLTGPWGWAFDPTQDSQTFAGSIAVQSVALAVRGSSLTAMNVAGTMVPLGQPITPIALPLGSTMVPIALTAGEISKTYQLVFNRGGTVLDQVVYGKASNAEANDRFGISVALAGGTLAVGAYDEASSAPGVNGNQDDNSVGGAGAVYIFVRTGTTWTQQAYLKASNPGNADFFGFSVALSGDTLAVGAWQEASAATGVNGNQNDNNALGAGAAYVFVRTGTTWTQQAYLKASNAQTNDYFGWSVALSGDTLAVGAWQEDSAAIGINGNQADNNATDSGAVYVFSRLGTSWTQQAYIKASNAGANDRFGYSVALSGDTLAVGAFRESSAATGVNGNQSDNSVGASGAAYVFVRNGMTWTQQAYLKASNPGTFDEFGYAIALSGDTLAIGTGLEDSTATGINGNQADNTAVDSGAVYVFVRTGTKWASQAYVKASNTGSSDQFGAAVALSGDTLAIGAYFESGGAAGVNPANGQVDNSAGLAGAVYIFR